MRHVAVVGSGPAGYYTAEALQKGLGDRVRIDILDRLPVPFGLIRTGVAPDHQSIKAVSRRYEAVNLTEHVRFVGHVNVGTDVSVDELMGLYDAVVLATGAPADRSLDIPGCDLPGVIGSAAFVGWYNGHPDFARLDPPLDTTNVAVIGNGNVALDVARILSKTPDEFHGSDIVAHALELLADSHVRTIRLIGRRGPHQIAMTPKELGELGHLSRAAPRVDPLDFPDIGEDALLEPGMRKSVSHLREFAANPIAKPVTIEFDFFAMPVAVEGKGRAERLVLEKTRLDEDLRSVGTGEHYTVPAGLVIACIGYRTPPISDVPYEHGRGRFANDAGLILPGLYCVGWARRGPSGTIGTNKPDGAAIAERIIAETGGPDAAGSGKRGRAGLDDLIALRGLDIVTFRDWQKIDAAEIAAARAGAPREKLVHIPHMLDARDLK
ncbi:FAD-dependent oxidoreductase [Sphingomonas lacunae]|uniref:FAD-dependent oxidoreductase n=1 Tax=Sphingomonas lacunae TaxID=2698828 RepID=A0A6M4AZ64_9SPHN|nr:FAD-dependent oxidoreductase [Sphingomonas lacunae]QJQ33369.1 FAD-dependent oxidoreductase [Sphingomonas lacunae]